MRHGNIQDYHVGRGAFYEAQQLQAVAGLPHDLQPRDILDASLDGLAQQYMIIRQGNAIR
jgi:hypothetical protein